MANLTINALLSMQKALNLRRQQLNEIKNAGTSRTIYRETGGNTTTTEPTYDIKKVDRKLTEINKAMWNIDQKIKEVNAMTHIEIQVDFNYLMSELE